MATVLPEGALQLVDEFCAKRVPDDLRNEIRLEQSVRGNAITIIERRPPWRPDIGPEWSSVKVAQLRLDEPTETWRLYCADSNGRWHVYDDIAPSPSVRPLLDEIDADPTGIFWG